VAERFDSIVEFAGVERFVDQQLKNYSSGMLLRLAYSVAIQVPFDILLLDEALAVGDAEFQQKCFETLAEMRANDKTVLLVSHDLAAVERLCDRALLLNQGTVAAVGEPAAVLAVYDERIGVDDAVAV
jgi:ABC-type polysaccharide/polyol phosphate transport system ATPase subunit